MLSAISSIDKEDDKMIKRGCMNTVQCILLLGILLFLTANPAAAAMNADQGFKPEENSMDTPGKTESRTIPPIDAAVVPNYQTASFGLG